MNSERPRWTAILAALAVFALASRDARARSDDLVNAMRAASGATVMRLVIEPTSNPDSTRLRLASEGHADEPWSRRFAEELLARSPFVAGGACRAFGTPVYELDDPAESTPRESRRVAALVTLDTKRGPVTIHVLFQERCAGLADTLAGSLGTFEIDANAPALFALVKEALSGDSALQAVELPRAPAGELPEGDAGRKRPAGMGAARGVVAIPDATREQKRVGPPPPPAPSPETPQVGGIPIDRPPEAIRRRTPHYPSAAREARIEGTVLILALIGDDGRVRDTRIVRSIPQLDRAAEETVRIWRFKPATHRGEPVEVWVQIPVRFSLF